MMYTKANYKWLLSELHEAVFALIQLHNTSKAQSLKSRYLSHVLSNHVKKTCPIKLELVTSWFYKANHKQIYYE